LLSPARTFTTTALWRLGGTGSKISFNFFDAHDLYVARDTSLPETIRRNLRERMKNAKQIVL